MRTRYRKILLTFSTAMVLGLSLSAPAHARFYLESTFFPSYGETNITDSNYGGSFTKNSLANEAGWNIDTRNTAGLVLWNHLFIGGSLNYQSQKTNRDATAADASREQSQTTFDYGPSIGFMYRHLRLIGTYLLSADRKWTDKSVQQDGTVVNDLDIENKGTGYQIVLGYAFPLSSKVMLGPSLVYRHASYSKQTATNKFDPSPAGTYTDRSFTTNSIETELKPMISLMIQF